MTEAEMIQKHEYVWELLMHTHDMLIRKFFDAESYEMFDEKIEVLEALNRGEAPCQIEHYYDVLELMPNNPYTIWE